jgi:protein-tyrosine kinase
MSRLYETLRRIQMEKQPAGTALPESAQPIELVNSIMAAPVELEGAPSAKIQVTEASRLVALTDPKSLGAEKFRALVARLENLRQKRELKSLQVTSAMINDGKSLVAANLAVTLAKHSGYKVLLVEGDLHRPTLASLFGLTSQEGLSQWWSRRENNEKIARYTYQLEDMPLWFLSSGSAFDQPSQILQSARFAETFQRLVGCFEWVVVDSTPMMPIVDANLWSRVVDGTLLVVREGVTTIKALKTGVGGLDNPKWVGMVLNEVSEFDRINYTDQYYAVKKQGKSPEKDKTILRLR